MALLNVASDAFVAPAPAAAPSLRGSNAAMAQAETSMRTSGMRFFSASLLQLGMPQAQSAPSSSGLPAIACGGAVAAAAVAAQRTGRAVKCQWAVFFCMWQVDVGQTAPEAGSRALPACPPAWSKSRSSTIQAGPTPKRTLQKPDGTESNSGSGFGSSLVARTAASLAALLTSPAATQTCLWMRQL